MSVSITREIWLAGYRRCRCSTLPPPETNFNFTRAPIVYPRQPIPPHHETNFAHTYAHTIERHRRRLISEQQSNKSCPHFAYRRFFCPFPERLLLF